MRLQRSHSHGSRSSVDAVPQRRRTTPTLTIVDDKWHVFPDWNGQPGGITGTILLAESHLAIHTWPERRGVTLDVYVCNFTEDNTGKAEQLFETLIAGLPSAEPGRQPDHAR